jgi:hypothetical protein
MNKLLTLSYTYLICPIASFLKKRGIVFLNDKIDKKANTYWVKVKKSKKCNFRSIF